MDVNERDREGVVKSDTIAGLGANTIATGPCPIGTGRRS